VTGSGRPSPQHRPLLRRRAASRRRLRRGDGPTMCSTPFGVSGESVTTASNSTVATDRRFVCAVTPQHRTFTGGAPYTERYTNSPRTVANNEEHRTPVLGRFAGNPEQPGTAANIVFLPYKEEEVAGSIGHRPLRKSVDLQVESEDDKKQADLSLP
jgi:hypothetical protein